MRRDLQKVDDVAVDGQQDAALSPWSGADEPVAADATQPLARRYHIHSTFLMYCAVALLLSVGAFHNNNNLLFWLFALAFSMIVVSGVISGPMLMGLRLERLAPSETAEGEVVRVSYRVTNINRWVPAFALCVRELPAAPARRWAAAGLGRPARDETAPRAGTLDRPVEAFVTYVGAGRSVVVEGLARATGRGVVPLESLAIFSDFPFGIVRKSVRFAAARVLLVRPGIEDAGLPASVDPRARPAAEQAGRSTQTSGEHFHALREYQPGDSPRLIAWRASARAAARDADGDSGGTALLVRQSTGTVTGRLDLVLDLAPAQSERAYERAIRRAAGLVRRASAAGMRVGLSVRGPGGNGRADRLAEPRTGRWQAARILNDLAMLPAFDPDQPARAEPSQALAGTNNGTVVVAATEAAA
jgi:uncharacterized protein (DUF58 family)